MEKTGRWEEPPCSAVGQQAERLFAGHSHVTQVHPACLPPASLPDRAETADKHVQTHGQGLPPEGQEALQGQHQELQSPASR